MFGPCSSSPSCFHPVILAAGKGQRAGGGHRSKAFLKIAGQPITQWTFEVFHGHGSISPGVIVVPANFDWSGLLDFRKQSESFGWRVVEGGTTGRDSLLAGLTSLRCENLREDPSRISNSWSMVHDGVRPFINQKLLSDLMEKARLGTASVTYSNIIETPAFRDSVTKRLRIINRSSAIVLRAPQVFKTNELIAAIRMSDLDGLASEDYPDSASIMNHYGHEFELVPGPQENIKLTFEYDFEGLEAKLGRWRGAV